MWDRVIAAMAAAAASDARLIALYGGSIRLAAAGNFRVPLLEYTLIGDAESELWNPMTVQFDQFVRQAPQLVESELALKALFLADLPIVLSGIEMWTEYAGGEVLSTPDLAQPNRDQYFGRAIRFRMTPLRAKYAAPAT